MRQVTLKTLVAFLLAATAIPALGEDFVGDELCIACHKERAKDFKTGKHASSLKKMGQEFICEQCHGSGKDHVRTADAAKIGNPDSMPPEASSAICLGCHDADKAGAHSVVHTDDDSRSCADCHTIHTD